MQIWWPAIFSVVTLIEGGTQLRTGNGALIRPTQQYYKPVQRYLVQPYAAFSVLPTVAQCDPNIGGIRARLNRPAFQYMSALFANVLNEQIINAEIPPITECVPGLPVDGCLKIYNIFVSRYRCPQRVLVYPDTPNKIVVSVQNFDIGITANLGGNLNILLPIELFGIVQVNVHQISLVVEIVIEEKCDRFAIAVAGCSMTVGYVDLYLERAGLIGDITNGLFRNIASELVKQMIPSKVCAMVPKLIDEKVNSQLGNIPTAISVGQILKMLGGLDGLIGSGISQCAKASHRCQSAEPHKLQKALVGQQLVPLSGGAYPKKAPFVAPYGATQHQLMTNQTKPKQQTDRSSTLKKTIPTTKNASIPGTFKVPLQRPPSAVGHDSSIKLNSTNGSSSGADVSEEMALAMLSELLDLNDTKEGKSKSHFTMDDIKKMLHNGTDNEMNRRLLYKLAEMTKSGETSEAREMLAALRRVARDLANRRKRSPEQSAVPVVNKSPPRRRLINAATTKTNETHESKATSSKKNSPPHAVVPLLRSRSLQASNKQPKVNGAKGIHLTENATKAHGCPTCAGSVVSSNVALNSALSIVGNPCAGCPGAGRRTDPLDLIKQLTRTIDLTKLCNIYLSLKLLRTIATCWDYSIDLKGEFSLFNQDQTPFCPQPTIFPGCANCMIQVIASDYTINSLFYHMHRAGLLSFRIGPDTPEIGPLMRTTCQEGGGSSSISLCVGEFLPALTKYPNKAIAVNIHTARAPVIILSRGCASIEFIADADICVTGTFTCEGGIPVGTIEIVMIADVCPQSVGGRLYGAGNVRVLRIAEKKPSLGLQPGTLDQLAVLGKEILTKALNDALAKGVNMKIPSGGGLPLTLHNTNFKIIEHAIHISSDFAISPSLLSGSASCPR